MEPNLKPQHRYALVLAGGDPIDPDLAGSLPADPWVIAADSGLDQAAALGITADLVIGDMDSVSTDALERAASTGVAIEEHPVDKDATDLELALERAAAAGFEDILLVGGNGGRIDHLLGNALLLAADRFAAINVEWWVRTTRVSIVRARNPVTIVGQPGDLVSLLSAGGAADGVTATGLRWALSGERLEPGSTRGISNEVVGATAKIAVDSGVLIVIHVREPAADSGGAI